MNFLSVSRNIKGNMPSKFIYWAVSLECSWSEPVIKFMNVRTVGIICVSSQSGLLDTVYISFNTCQGYYTELLNYTITLLLITITVQKIKLCRHLRLKWKSPKKWQCNVLNYLKWIIERFDVYVKYLKKWKLQKSFKFSFYR